MRTVDSPPTTIVNHLKAQVEDSGVATRKALACLGITRQGQRVGIVSELKGPRYTTDTFWDIRRYPPDRISAKPRVAVSRSSICNIH